MASKRKPRSYEKTCDCGAYKFPHRMLGGRCEGFAIVINEFSSDQSQCTDCIYQDDQHSCQIIDGIEDVKHATCLQDFIRYEGIKPPVAWQQGIQFYKGARA